MKKYKLTMEYTAYSKKKGAHQRKNVIAKDLESYEDCVSWIKKEYPRAIIKGNSVTNIGGLLYPSTIKIS